MSCLHAFVDEYGDTSIAVEKSGVTAFFIITAVLVSDDVALERDRAESIRRRFFQSGEMKSSAVGADDERRRRVLEAISNLNIHTYTLAVDKRELYKESGLAYKQSFFKYTHRRLYETIYRIYEDVLLIADEHGSEGFMRSFENYLDRQIPPNLFSERSFKFSNSRHEVLLQVADMLSGSIARTLDPKKLSRAAASLMKLVMKRAFAVDVWPHRSLPAPGIPGIFTEGACLNANDELVRRHCLQQVDLFLDDEGANDSNEERWAQAELLRFLLFKLKFIDSKLFISTGEILDYLASNAGVRLSEHALRSAVIAPLRDAGIILASGSSGYKIPVCEADLTSFLAHADSIIRPMLNRIRRARNDLKMRSNDTLDILASPRFDHLRSFVEMDARFD